MVCDLLHQMPHGIQCLDGGWAVTDTVQGDWVIFNSAFLPELTYTFSTLDGKVPGTDHVEWIQQVIPVPGSKALAIDANRGLLAVDFQNAQYTVYQPDPNWCVQDAVLLP
jgi:hypothetical protein